MMSQMPPTPDSALYDRVCDILNAARTGVARTVNTAQVLSNWLIGREIFEEEQQGQARAEYGETLLNNLAQKLKQAHGRGFSSSSLKYMRQFYLGFPHLLSDFEKGHAVRGQLAISSKLPELSISNPSWQPGQLHPNLSWTHYRTLLPVTNLHARSFYEIEALKNNWSARELERQINSLLFERLAKSTDKQGLLKLATQGQVIQKPIDVFKDPFVMEFLDLPESPRLVETDLETALINDAIVKYTLGPAHQTQIFTNRYQFHLPTEAELMDELLRDRT